MEGKKGISEDWLSLWMGLFIFVLGLGLFLGLDILGWGVKTKVWTDITKAISPFSGALKGMPGLTSLFLTYLFMLVITMVGAIAMSANVGRFWWVYPGLLDRLWLLAPGAFRLYRRHRRPPKMRYRLVLEAHR